MPRGILIEIAATCFNMIPDSKVHIEPKLNHSIIVGIKSVCFDFGPTNMGSSVIKTGGSEDSLLPYFYHF